MIARIWRSVNHHIATAELLSWWAVAGILSCWEDADDCFDNVDDNDYDDVVDDDDDDDDRQAQQLQDSSAAAAAALP